jgi:tripartite-type tricarboxylate transporter receptor subunit TctC
LKNWVYKVDFGNGHGLFCTEQIMISILKSNIASRDWECGEGRTRRAIVFFSVLLWFSGSTWADEYPNRPITIIVRLAAGGVSDVMTRIYADSVSKKLGQPIVIENRPTGSGAVAAITLKAAAADGYTLLVFPISQHASIPAMDPNVGYDPIKGNQPITLLFSIATLVVVPATSAISSLDSLKDFSRQKPGGLNVGSPGLGTPAHLSGAKLMNATATAVQFVHYRGAAPMMSDVIPGRVDAAMFSSLTAKPFLLSRQIKALVSDATEIWPIAPEIPLLKNIGLANAGLASWFGIAAAPGIPKS